MARFALVVLIAFLSGCVSGENPLSQPKGHWLAVYEPQMMEFDQGRVFVSRRLMKDAFQQPAADQVILDCFAEGVQQAQCMDLPFWQDLQMTLPKGHWLDVYKPQLMEFDQGRIFVTHRVMKEAFQQPAADQVILDCFAEGIQQAQCMDLPFWQDLQMTLANVQESQIGEGEIPLSHELINLFTLQQQAPDDTILAITPDGSAGNFDSCLLEGMEYVCGSPMDSKRVLNVCRQLSGGRECKIFAVGRRVVWKDRDQFMVHLYNGLETHDTTTRYWEKPYNLPVTYFRGELHLPVKTEIKIIPDKSNESNSFQLSLEDQSCSGSMWYGVRGKKWKMTCDAGDEFSGPLIGAKVFVGNPKVAFGENKTGKQLTIIVPGTGPHVPLRIPNDLIWRTNMTYNGLLKYKITCLDEKDCFYP